MKVWKGNEVECETAQHALFLDPNGRAGSPSGEPSSNLTEEPKIHPQRGLWVTQLFLLKKGKPNGQNSDDVSHNRQRRDRLWSQWNVLGFELRQDERSKCRILTRGLYKSRALIPALGTLLNGKTCSGRAVISSSAFEVMHRRHHWDLQLCLRSTTTSWLNLDQPRYCAVQQLYLPVSGKYSVWLLSCGDNNFFIFSLFIF